MLASRRFFDSAAYVDGRRERERCVGGEIGAFRSVLLGSAGEREFIAKISMR